MVSINNEIPCFSQITTELDYKLLYFLSRYLHICEFDIKNGWLYYICKSARTIILFSRNIDTVVLISTMWQRQCHWLYVLGYLFRGKISHAISHMPSKSNKLLGWKVCIWFDLRITVVIILFTTAFTQVTQQITKWNVLNNNQWAAWNHIETFLSNRQTLWWDDCTVFLLYCIEVYFIVWTLLWLTRYCILFIAQPQKHVIYYFKCGWMFLQP